MIGQAAYGKVDFVMSGVMTTRWTVFTEKTNNKQCQSCVYTNKKMY